MYVLETEGFYTEILEVFPDRDMFVRGDAWLVDSTAEVERDKLCASAIDVRGLGKSEWRAVNAGSEVVN